MKISTGGTGKTLGAITILLLLSLVASSPLFSPGWFAGHEGTHPFERVVLVAHEIANGFYYPRWLSLTYEGLGSPFFNFYSPGFYLACAYLSILGVPVVTSMKIVCCAFFLAGAVGMFLWCRRYYSHSGAFLAALLYLFAPYHFVDIYVRGSMAEFAALAILPFLFYGIDLSFSNVERRRGIYITGAAAAAIILTHNLSAFMVAPFAAAYFYYCARRCGSGRREVLAALAGPAAGAGLSAFYWLPVLLELKYLNRFEASVTAGSLAYDQHFVYPRQFFSTFWGFGFSNPGPKDDMSFQIGVAILFFSALAGATLVIDGKRDRRHPAVLLLLGVAALYLTTALSSWIYLVVPGYSYVQFPWRFLGVATLFLSALGGSVADVVGFERSGSRYLRGSLLAVAVAGCIILSGGQRQVAHRIPASALPAAETAGPKTVGGYSFGSVCASDEYLPLWCFPWTVRAAGSFAHGPVATGGSVGRVRVAGARMSFDAGAGPEGATVTIPWLFFPGWQATIDGLPAATHPGQRGFLTLTVPAGEHHLKVWFGSTPPRTFGAWLSRLTLLALMAGFLRRSSPARTGETAAPGVEG